MSELKSGEDKNKEFYNKLVNGLKDMTAETSPDTDLYRKYSHHLGRAEFGSLRRRESTGSNTSVIKTPQLARRQEPGYEQMNSKLSLSRKVSRQDSDEKRMKRGQSKISDTSEAMPDLEIEDEIESEMLMRIGNIHNRSVTPVAERSSSLGGEGSSTMLQIPLPEVRRSEAVQHVSEQKQKIRAVKERVQSGLMTVVGMGVMAYLTTLDTMGGGGS